ncbi:hypothetical protein [Christiangramia sp.]|uniref:hypothetical protein n=1 Tax=Christiangramia sp. TaxID=1931228 RepID=UPI002612B1EA|nr:hypothetical protein [Christiangramia sp.]
MSIQKFKNSFDLVNYLCREDVLGEVEIEYTQLRSSTLEASSFNFEYPDLQEHLDSIAWNIIENNGASASSIQVIFYQEEDEGEDYNYSLEGTEEEFDLINESIHNLIKKALGPDVFAVITLKGSDYNLKSTKILKWEFFNSTPEGEKKINLSKEEDEKILNGIFSILRGKSSPIECLEEYEFEVDDERVNLLEKGALIANAILSLKDDIPFELDTEKLKKA